MDRPSVRGLVSSGAAHDEVLTNYAASEDWRQRAGMLPMVAATTDDPLTTGADDQRTAQIDGGRQVRRIRGHGASR